MHLHFFILSLFVTINLTASENSQHLFYKLSNSANTNNGGCRTIVYSEPALSSTGVFESEIQEIDFIPTLFIRVSYNDSHNLAQYVQREHSEEEIKDPFYTHLRHTSSCQLVFINGFQDHFTTFQAQIQHLTLQRLVRSEKDFFVFIGTETNIMEFEGTNFVDEIRNKMFLAGELTLSHLAKPSWKTEKNLFNMNPFSGKELLVAVVFGKGVIRFEENEEMSHESASGVYYQVILASSIQFNYTFKLKLASGNGATGFKKDGYWYGAVGDVYNRKADFGVGMGLTAPRDGIADNGASFGENKRVFYVRDSEQKTSWRAIFSPFKTYVWGWIAGAVLALIPAYYASLWIKFRKPVRTSSVSLLNVAVMTVTALTLEQSSSHEKFWTGFRIRALTVLWTMFGLIMTAGYRSRLIYALTFVPSDQLPTTHLELLERNFKILFRNYGGIAYRFTKESKDPVQMAIFSRAHLFNTSQGCIVGALLLEHSACLDWESNADFADASNVTYNAYQTKPLIIKSKHSVLKTLMGWTYRKGSPLRDTMDKFLFHVFAAGLFLEWRNADWFETKRQGAIWLRSNRNHGANAEVIAAFEQESDAPKALDISAMFGALAILAVGIVISTLAWIREVSQRCVTLSGKKIRRLSSVVQRVVKLRSFLKKPSS